MTLSSSIKLAVFPAVGFALVAGLMIAEYDSRFQALDFSAAAKNCAAPKEKNFRTRLTSGQVRGVDLFVCEYADFYEHVLDSPYSIAAVALIASVLIPIIQRQSYFAASLNNRAFLLGPVAVAFLHLLGRFFGAGFALASFGTLFAALGFYQQFRRNGSLSIPIVPLPAYAVYTSNFPLIILVFASYGLIAFDTEGSFWTIAFTTTITYPLWLLIFLYRASAGSRIPRDEKEARDQLAWYSAEEVSYSFERTWSYYRTVSLVSATFYWFGVSRIVYGYFDRTATFTPHATVLFQDFLALVAFLVFTLAIERLTIRSYLFHPSDSSPAAPAPATHPLTGEPIPQLQKDCIRAISLAPAGSPSLERSPLYQSIVGLLGGPGMAACLWWSGGEEEAGWLARRAWREAKAAYDAKAK